MVTSLWDTHDPNFGSLSWFWSCKEHTCPLSLHLGLWRMLEIPDWGLASWSWFGYGHWSLIHPWTKFCLSLLILKVQRTSMSFRSWVRIWRMLEVTIWGLAFWHLFWYIQKQKTWILPKVFMSFRSEEVKILLGQNQIISELSKPLSCWSGWVWSSAENSDCSAQALAEFWQLWFC